MTRQNHKRGFNLIEAAIVLGVVGLVIGGIWIAASAVSDKMRVNEAIKGLTLMADRTTRLLSRYDIETAGSGDITDFVIASGAAPPGWVQGSTIIDPWGESVALSSSTPDVYAPTRIDVCFQNVPVSRCKALVARAPTQDIIGIYAEPDFFTSIPIPVDSPICSIERSWFCYNYEPKRNNN